MQIIIIKSLDHPNWFSSGEECQESISPIYQNR